MGKGPKFKIWVSHDPHLFGLFIMAFEVVERLLLSLHRCHPENPPLMLTCWSGFPCPESCKPSIWQTATDWVSAPCHRLCVTVRPEETNKMWHQRLLLTRYLNHQGANPSCPQVSFPAWLCQEPTPQINRSSQQWSWTSKGTFLTGIFG